MRITEIVALLTAERDRLDAAIKALSDPATHHAKPSRKAMVAPSALTGAPPVARKRKPLTAAQKKAHSERMKAFWAERRKKN